MLQKYNLVNVPEGGVRHSVGKLGLVNIDEHLTDALAEQLIAAGLNHYFEPVGTQPAQLTPENGEAKESESTTSRKKSGIAH